MWYVPVRSSRSTDSPQELELRPPSRLCRPAPRAAGRRFSAEQPKRAPAALSHASSQTHAAEASQRPLKLQSASETQAAPETAPAAPAAPAAPEAEAAATPAAEAAAAKTK